MCRFVRSVCRASLEVFEESNVVLKCKFCNRKHLFTFLQGEASLAIQFHVIREFKMATTNLSFLRHIFVEILESCRNIHNHSSIFVAACIAVSCSTRSQLHKIYAAASLVSLSIFMHKLLVYLLHRACCRLNIC